MSNDINEQEVRTAITTTTNVTSGYDSTYGVEIPKMVDRKIQDILFNQMVLRNQFPRKSMNGQLSYHWNIRPTNNDSSAFYSEGGDGTASTGSKVQLIATALAFRTDWEVTGLFEAASAGYYDAVADEVSNAAVAHGVLEETQIILGNDSGAGGDSSGFLGLKQLLNSYVTLGDTTTIYGIARASGKTYLDCQLVNADSADLALSHLDNADSYIQKKGGRTMMYVMSFARAEELNSLLQTQQRFMGTTDVAGGFVVPTYRGIPILRHKSMDTAGSSDTDTAIFALGADIWEMRVLKETTNVMATMGRTDAVGGYIKTYEVLVCKDLTKNCLIYGLTAL